ncbi:Uncharacterised protein [Bordetella pertussis]|nr:Uncharacterised protein [Bordetella pertussis]CPK45567.1 Uncharacterised protein [Bordetella pertussis]
MLADTPSAWAMRAWVSRLRRSSTIASALAGAIARGETVGREDASAKPAWP